MRGLGTAVLILGILGVIGALSMDVSVPSGIGRVNNLGLMSQRQNLTMVAGLVALGGLLMVIFGYRRSVESPVSTFDYESRTCPFCAETVKAAAIKCKHCAADLDPIEHAATSTHAGLPDGWTVRIERESADELTNTAAVMADAGFPLLQPDGMTVILGGFIDKAEAKYIMSLVQSKYGLPAYIYWMPPAAKD